MLVFSLQEPEKKIYFTANMLSVSSQQLTSSFESLLVESLIHKMSNCVGKYLVLCKKHKATEMNILLQD